MNKIIEELCKWREARNMQNNEFVAEEQVASMLDECKEVLLAKTNEHKAEEYCDVAIFAFNGLGLLGVDYKPYTSKFSNVAGIIELLSIILNGASEERVGYELNFIIATSSRAVENLGYNFQKMMLEKIKVISSREQDPEQAKDWALNGASGKWEKNKAQSKDTLYKPDFESCRIGK